MHVDVESLRIPLRTPLRSAWGTLEERPLFLVSITGADGVTGRGEAAPLEPYDGVPARAVAAALRAYSEVLDALDDDAPGTIVLEECRRVADLPQALAAIDIALWDRAGRHAGEPVAALLTDAAAREVPVNATIGADDPETAGRQARRAADAGFSCVKVKVGTGLDADAARLAAVREAAGEGVAIRIDANGAWDPEGAVGAIARLGAVGLELVEEPVHGVSGLRAVRERTTTRIAMDETAGEVGAVGAGAADAVCLKVSRCGGISALLVQAALVRAAGGDPYLASTFDGPRGIAAAVHAAAALRITTPCGLATLDALDLPAPDALAPRDGVITVPTGPGLGLEGPH